jgi:DNA phosphorothioation-dependent restriction protein DptG
MTLINPVVLVEELEQLRHELANTKKLLTLQESINHLLGQEVVRLRDEIARALDEPTQNEQDLYAENQRLQAVVQAARQLVACPASGALVCHERLEDAIQALDRASA